MKRTRIFVNHLLRAVDNTYYRTRRIEDARRDTVISKTLNFPYGRAQIT